MMTTTHSDPITLIPLSDALGAEVRGVDVTKMDEATFQAVHDAWMGNQILLFRDQAMTDAALVRFSEMVGELDIAPPNENGSRFVDAHPEILVISNVVENGVALGSLGAGEAVWHSDMNYIDEPPTASVLWGLEVPATGGRTGFLNMYKALETLPADLRHRIEGRFIKHDSSTNSAGYLREGAVQVTDVTTCPGAVHPIIRTHPVTRRAALYLGRRRNAYIVDMDVEESEAVLDALWAHTENPDFYWHHSWRPGDVLMWDNRCTMHRRDKFDATARRIMHRTQIKGSKPFFQEAT